MAEFNGTIGITKEDSISSYKSEKSLSNRPNIMYIVLDDVGFAQLGCYGSTIHTPNIDKLAEGGLRYNNFHTTAICSATRASLLTGANHHSAGVSTVVDIGWKFPKPDRLYESIVCNDSGSIKNFWVYQFCCW